jgi:hypothetical protein
MTGCQVGYEKGISQSKICDMPFSLSRLSAYKPHKTYAKTTQN